MRQIHYITIVVAIAVTALIYWGGNTIPPKKKQARTDGQPPSGPMSAQAMVQPASFDSILAASRIRLTAQALAEIDTLNKKILTIRDSVAMAPLYTDIAKIWQAQKQIPVAAYYYAKAAKLENSEKNLNFAGQLFLNLIHDAGSPGMGVWEAQQSIVCFKRSQEINPANDMVKMALAAAYIEGSGETMNGVQLLLGIVREKPDNIPANLMLGQLAIQSGQFDKAVQRLETVIKQEPKNTEALYFLAEAYKGKGDKAKAIALFEQCKQIVNKPEFTKEIDQYINTFK